MSDDSGTRTSEIMHLARETANKLATPANWFVLESEVRKMENELVALKARRLCDCSYGYVLSEVERERDQLRADLAMTPDDQRAAHTPGEWCSNLRCVKCYTADRWQHAKMDEMERENHVLEARLDAIQAALDTNETDDDLVRVAKDAHVAELDLWRLKKRLQDLIDN